MNSLLSLIRFVGSLQGVGEKSAERIVLSLISRRDRHKLIELLDDVYKNVSKCSVCGNLDTQNPCFVCQDSARQNSQICIVADVLDLWAVEKADFFKGKYYVLGHKLDSVIGILPEDIKLEPLISRIKQNTVKEVIIALNADINGQTAVFFIHDKLKSFNLEISVLSCGLPIGGDLDRLSYGTIIAAFEQRKSLGLG